MKKSLKLLSLFIIAITAMLVSKEVVFAGDSSPATFKASTYAMNPKPLGLTNNISIKKTTDGKYVYCYDVNKSLPTTDITYTKSNLITDPAISYIIASGQDDKTDKDFFATQAALWIYLVETGQMKDTETNYIRNIRGATASGEYKNDPISIDIKNILGGAYNIANNKTEEPTLDITTRKVEFTLNKGKYVSSVIEVETNLSDYEVVINDSYVEAEINWVDNGFTISVDEDNIDGDSAIVEAKITGNSTKYNVYKYNASNSNYQDMLAVYPEKITLSDKISVAFEVEKDEPLPITKDPTVIVISKQDITNKEELPGATLIIRNSAGEIVEQWVSTNEPREFDALPVGKYTLEEISSPDGYTLNSEKISFTVKKDGKIDKVVMYNTPEEIEEIYISISKQDITTKEELPGATLIIRNSKGEEIERWVSTDEPHIIKVLEEGTYTLEEIIAPEGYILSSEVITFEVKDNGVVTEVVMFNSPEPEAVIPVPPTGTFANSLSYILGGLIIIIGSVLIYRNVKKEQ